jgi:hypothetical protein
MTGMPNALPVDKVKTVYKGSDSVEPTDETERPWNDLTRRTRNFGNDVRPYVREVDTIISEIGDNTTLRDEFRDVVQNEVEYSEQNIDIGDHWKRKPVMIMAQKKISSIPLITRLVEQDSSHSVHYKTGNTHSILGTVEYVLRSLRQGNHYVQNVEDYTVRPPAPTYTRRVDRTDLSRKATRSYTQMKTVAQWIAFMQTFNKNTYTLERVQQMFKDSSMTEDTELYFDHYMLWEHSDRNGRHNGTVYETQVSYNGVNYEYSIIQ